MSPDCSAQEIAGWLGPASVLLEDWEIEDADAIRAGQMALIYEEGGPRIATYYLAPETSTDSVAEYRSYTPPEHMLSLKISDFDHDNRNRLGGYFNVFHRDPSSARLAIKSLSDSSRALSFSGFRGDEGFCGMWIHLFDFSLPLTRREYLDVRGFSSLEFFVKRASSDEAFLIKMADAEWEAREDAIVVGDLDSFVIDKSTYDGWQRVSIPIEELPARLNKALLASIVFEQVSPGYAEMSIRTMTFSRSGESGATLKQSRPVETSAVEFATWVWNTEELQERDTLRDSVLSFLSEEDVTTVYLQLPHQGSGQPGKGVIEFDRDRMRLLIRELTRRGFRTYALDGYAYYALPEYHKGVLSTVQNVIDYNAAVEPNARFVGVRYDIEPYLMPGFHGPSQSRMLTGLLSLLETMTALAHDAGLVVGADIPFWYDARSEYTGMPVAVGWKGAVKPVSEHIIDIVDDVAVMDYRTSAYGADGTIRHAAGELEYSDRVGKPLYIALETHPLPDERLLDFHDAPQRELPSDPGQVLTVAAVEEDSLMLFYVLDLIDEPDASVRRQRVAAFEENRGNQDYYWWSVDRHVFVPAEKISFAGHGIDRYRETVSETIEALSTHRSFKGIAVHHSASFQDLASQAAAVTASH